MDPFEESSVLNVRQVGNRKLLAIIFVPLLIVSIFSIIALYTSYAALERATVHPECSCKKFMHEKAHETRYQLGIRPH